MSTIILRPDDVEALVSVAKSVGMEVWNPEGGLRSDAELSDVLEVVCDIAQGAPYYIHGVEPQYLTEVEEALIMSGFLRGMSDGANR